MKKCITKTRRAFTLIELLVVITIIGILAAMLFPVFGTILERARGITCTNNLKQLGLSLAQYYNDYNSMPINGGTPTAPTITSPGAYAILSNYVGGATKLFVCPSDSYKPAKDFTTANFKSKTSISYAYFGTNSQWQSTTPGPVYMDRPGATTIASNGVWLANSPHKGRGGNVLYNDGHVEWKTRSPAALQGNAVIADP
jgi:prepilin-type N-terminal cleavage/methylation domain-containing protein/prepilin-type processing-associated H-X9-DG protein